MDFRYGYTFGFDLTPDACDGACFQKGNLRIEIHFAAPLPETINVLAYAESKSVVELDKSLLDGHHSDRHAPSDGPAHQVNLSWYLTQRRTAHDDLRFPGRFCVPLVMTPKSTMLSSSFLISSRRCFEHHLKACTTGFIVGSVVMWKVPSMVPIH